MQKIFVFAFALTAVFPSTPSAEAGDWPWWRGPDRNGVAGAEQDPPLEIGESSSIKWSADLPGRAHGSPCVVGDKVYIATATEDDDQIQSLVCLDRATGKQLWSTELHKGGYTQKSNKKASWASTSPACDGERVYLSLFSHDAVHTSALDLSGKILWQTKITDYKIHQGYAASPALYENLVIVAADNKKDGALAALDRKTGNIVWKVKRGPKENYPSPIILKVGGKAQLFLTGVNKVSSYDPLTGKANWEIEGATTECVTSTVTDGTHIYSSGGYPKNHVAAYKADGSRTEPVWEVKEKVYVPSMLIHGDHLYAVMDNGVAICWNSATGEEMWKERLGGNYSASPILVGENIYAASESGEVFIFEASPKGLNVLAKNKVGSEIFATPVICDSEIYLRVANYQGETRSEQLVCFGKK
jgi:outer membrane protein assembly factor BamB